jgi:hypothetical protein
MCGAVHISTESVSKTISKSKLLGYRCIAPQATSKRNMTCPSLWSIAQDAPGQTFKPVIKHNQSGVSKELPCASSLARRDTEPDQPVDRRWCIRSYPSLEQTGHLEVGWHYVRRWLSSHSIACGMSEGNAARTVSGGSEALPHSSPSFRPAPHRVEGSDRSQRYSLVVNGCLRRLGVIGRVITAYCKWLGLGGASALTRPRTTR